MLESGTYVIQLYTHAWETNMQYWERCSGIMAWWNGSTNSTIGHEIPLSKAGHATNNHNIRLRVLRQSIGGSNIKLQITDSVAWSGAGAIKIQVRKLI